jgi:CHASE2 domain-containing sensor protein
MTDMRWTPVGKLGGLFIHGNYVEALLYSRTYAPAGESLSITLEVVAALVVIAILALRKGLLVRLGLVALLGIVLPTLCLVFFQNLGVFLDVFMPTILLICHTIAEHVLDWREDSLKLRLMEI